MAVSVINSGYRPDTFDSRDKPYYYNGVKDPNLFQKKNLWTEKQAWLSQVYNQSSSGSCVANATAAAIRYLAHKVQEETGAATTGTSPVLDPSRLFIYYNARCIEYLQETKKWPVASQVSDSGCQIRNAMKSINLFGIASEAKWPFKIETVPGRRVVIGREDRPPNSAYEEARGFHAVEYCRLDPDNTEAAKVIMTREEKNAVGVITLARLKQCLVEGYPVVFGFWYYWDEPGWLPCQDEGDYESLPNLLPEQQHQGPSGNFGGHAVLAVGFDNDRKRVLCQNSWGLGTHDHFWMGYEWITDFEATDDFWMIRLLDEPSVNGLPLRPNNGPGAPNIELSDPSSWSKVDLPGDTAFTGGWASTIVSTRRLNGFIDCTWITPSGGVQDVYWSSRDSPAMSIVADQGSAVPGGALTSVPSGDSELEVFWTSQDGAVRGAHWNGNNWVSNDLQGEGVALPGAGIDSVSGRQDDRIDVWWIASDGAIAWASRAGPVKTEWKVNKIVEPGSANIQSSVLSYSLGEKHMEVLWVDDKGAVMGTNWLGGENGTDWSKPYELAPPGSAALETHMAFASRGEHTAEIFFVSPEGVLREKFWYKGEGWLDGRIPGEPKARVDSDLAAVSMTADRVDLIYIAPDNSIQGLKASGSWEAYTVAEAGSASGGTPIGVCHTQTDFSIVFVASDNKPVALSYKPTA